MTTDIDNIIEQLKELYPYASRYIELKQKLIRHIKSVVTQKLKEAPTLREIVKEVEAYYKLPLLILDNGDKIEQAPLLAEDLLSISCYYVVIDKNSISIEYRDAQEDINMPIASITMSDTSDTVLRLYAPSELRYINKLKEAAKKNKLEKLALLLDKLQEVANYITTIDEKLYRADIPLGSIREALLKITIE